MLNHDCDLLTLRVVLRGKRISNNGGGADDGEQSAVVGSKISES